MLKKFPKEIKGKKKPSRGDWKKPHFSWAWGFLAKKKCINNEAKKDLRGTLSFVITFFKNIAYRFFGVKLELFLCMLVQFGDFVPLFPFLEIFPQEG